MFKDSIIKEKQMKINRFKYCSKSHLVFLTLVILAALGARSSVAQISDSNSARGFASGEARIWQATGPFGGDVLSLAIDPRNSDVVLIGTQDGQIFRSTDAGMTWRQLKPGLKVTGYALTVILFDRARPNVIYAGIQQIGAVVHDSIGGGVFISEDAGKNWRELAAMHNRSVRGMVQSIKDPNVFAVAARDGIYRTMDRGATWQRITPDNDPELRNFHSVAIDPRDTNKIYAGTTHLPWKTIDGGQAWKRAGSKEAGMIDDSDIFAIHIDEENPEIVLMSACSGIYRSTNATKQWTKIQGIPSTSRRTHVIFQHPTRPNWLFAGTTEGLWRSTDSGEHWSRTTLPRLVINSVAVHPNKPDRIFLGTNDYGVLISNDGGESYEPSNSGFTSRQVRSVLADRVERGRVYAGVIFDDANGGLFISEDGGITWQQSMQGIGIRDVYSLYQSFTNSGTIYAGTNRGIFRSDDHGRTWALVKKEESQEMKMKYPSSQSSISSTSRPRYTSAAVKLIAQKRTKPRAKHRTKKRETTVKAPPPKSKSHLTPKADSGLVNLESQVFHLATFASRSDNRVTILLAATWDGLFSTTDEKKGWKRVKLVSAQNIELTRSQINAIATHPKEPGLIWIGTEDGLLVSHDDGKTFTRLTINDESNRIKAIAFDPRRVEMVYVGTANGFFRSTDGGRNWEKRGGGMPLVTGVSALEVNQINPDELYVGDHLYGGFYRSRNRGKTWEPLDISSLPSHHIWALKVDPFDQNRLYAGSFSGGVYVMNATNQRNEVEGR